MTSGTKQGSSVVTMLEIRHNGKQVVAPVVVGGFGTQNGIRIDSNAITSLYGKNYSISKVLRDAIDQEANGQFRLYYLDKGKATALLQRARVLMPKMPASNNGFIHTLSDSRSPVNMKITNQTESQQFKRWFGDWQKHPEIASKVVNEDGSPKIMYHGTTQDFSVFRQSQSGALGKGIYLSESKDFARGFTYQNGQATGTVMECYVNSRSPYVVNDPGNYDSGKLQEQGYDGIWHRSAVTTSRWITEV